MGGNGDTVRAIEAAWNENRLDDLDRYFASNFDNASSATPGLPLGLAGAKIAHQGVMRSFPDRRSDIVDLLEEDDRVFIRTRVSGSNQGGFPAFGVPANGNPFAIDSWSVYRFADGLVAQHWGLNDGLTLLMQLGAIPAPGGADPA